MAYPTVMVIYYSTNCNTIQIWSCCSRYLSSAGYRYPAVYDASYVGRKSEVKKCRQKDFKNVTSFVVNLLNNKTIILLNLAEYRNMLSIRRYSARFRRIVKYTTLCVRNFLQKRSSWSPSPRRKNTKQRQ